MHTRQHMHQPHASRERVKFGQDDTVYSWLTKSFCRQGWGFLAWFLERGKLRTQRLVFRPFLSSSDLLVVCDAAPR